MDKANKLLNTVKEAFMATQEIKMLYAISNGLTQKIKEFDQAVNDLAEQLQTPIDDENQGRVNTLVNRLHDKMLVLDGIIENTRHVIDKLNSHKEQ